MPNHILPSAVVLVLSAITMIGLHRYIRVGTYPRVPIQHDGEEWYAVPAHLRLSLFVSYGAVLGAIVTLFFSPSLESIEYASRWGAVLLPFIMFIIESNETAQKTSRRKRTTILVAFVLGVMISISLIDIWLQ